MTSTACIRRRAVRSSQPLVRFLSTQPHLPPSEPLPPPSPPPPRPPRARLTALSPRRPAARPLEDAITSQLKLPPTFGRNQILPVSNSTRAILEEVVDSFHAPIRYAFAYGSGVFEQQGQGVDKTKKPMLDFIFAVSHPEHWHSMNLNQNPDHYALHARLLGSDFVGRVQDWGPAGVWFNPFVPVAGVNIKYGVISVDNLCNDLLTWHSLYIAGRMHKPIRIIEDDPRVRLTQQVNLTSAIRTALLTLPETFEERELFERIAGLSYSGDPRMMLPFENRSKVANIVNSQTEQFKELYYRLVVGLPGVEWSERSTKIHQDLSPAARDSHVRKLPSNLRARVDRHFARLGGPAKEADEAAFWVRVAGDPTLPDVLKSEVNSIVRWSSTAQTVKGVVTSGVGHSLRYATDKLVKYWRGRTSAP